MSRLSSGSAVCGGLNSKVAISSPSLWLRPFGCCPVPDEHLDHQVAFLGAHPHKSLSLANLGLATDNKSVHQIRCSRSGNVTLRKLYTPWSTFLSENQLLAPFLEIFCNPAFCANSL